MPKRLPIRLCEAEDGFQLIELVIAVAVISISILGLAGAMTLGVSAVGQSRQRSAAAAVAAERIEIARNLPYEEVGLDVAPAHDTDPESPDHWVTTETPARYDAQQGGGLLETLVVGGAVRHIEDPVVSGPTQLYVYQYVTEVDDPDTDTYKRITVVVTWRKPMNPGVSSRIVTSTFVGRGQVVVPEDLPAGLEPEPMSEPQGAPEPVAACASEDPPTGSVAIVSGAGAAPGYTNSKTVQVRVEPTSEECDDLMAELSNDGSNFVAVDKATRAGCEDPPCPWQAVTVAWTVPEGEGPKIVYARLVDGSPKTSDVMEANVVLDQTPPTVPGGLSQVSCTLTGNDRVAQLSWAASTDAHLSGYRLYRSVNSEPYGVVSTVGSTTAQDTSKKSHGSVRYLVRAFDWAGNESGESNVVTYSKNSC